MKTKQKSDKVKSLPEIGGLNPCEVDYFIGLSVLYDGRVDVIQQEMLENAKKKLTVSELKQLEAKYQDLIDKAQNAPARDSVPTARDSYLQKLMFRVIKYSMKSIPRYSFKDADGGAVVFDGWDTKTLIEAAKVSAKINESHRLHRLNKAKIEHLTSQTIEDDEELDNLISLEDGLDHLRAKAKEAARNV